MSLAGQHRKPDMSGLDIILVSYRFSHHYSVSGYNRLAAYLECRTIVTPGLAEMLTRLITTDKGLGKLRSKTGLSGYFAESRWLEWMVRSRMRSTSPSVFHFLYPENCYYSTATARRSSGTKVVATYHQPVEESRQFIRKTEAISRLDGVVLLSESQKEFFAPLIEPEKIFVVPHGIDLDFFKPSPVVSWGKRIIAVGNWLRDFPTLVAALHALARMDPEIICDVVSLKQNATLFSGLGNVRFHAGISPEALRGLYHHASCAVLCLTGAAANNALLESMACGLPIVATDLPAIREYTTVSGCRYIPAEDPVACAESIRAVLRDHEAGKLMRKENLNHVQRYGWERIAGRMMEIYSAVGRTR
jgi:glycosyltransferase involved in cell wall biosynthesis